MGRTRPVNMQALGRLRYGEIGKSLRSALSDESAVLIFAASRLRPGVRRAGLPGQSAALAPGQRRSVAAPP